MSTPSETYSWKFPHQPISICLSIPHEIKWVGFVFMKVDHMTSSLLQKAYYADNAF